MYRKKNFISLGMSLVLAAGITVTPVTAADFTGREEQTGRKQEWICNQKK